MIGIMSILEAINSYNYNGHLIKNKIIFESFTDCQKIKQF